MSDDKKVQKEVQQGCGLMLGFWLAAIVIGIYLSWDKSSLWPMAFPVIVIVYDLLRLARHLPPEE